MSRRYPKAPASAKPPVKETPEPLQRLADPASDKRAALRNTLDSVPEAVSPSIASATAFPVAENQYTTRERRAAGYALDYNGTAQNALTFVNATGFPGFPTLSLLAQLPEYRSMHESLADATVRMWGNVKASDSTDPAILEQIENELKRIDLRAAIRQVVIHDQAFGGAHVYFKLKNDEAFRNTPLVMRPYTVRKGSFEGLRVIEPYWVTPNFYNSIDPTAPDFYKPSSWWMLGTEVHATRLETVVSRPVPDMLKPTYSFRGISMTQLAMQYVDNWLRTRQSVSDTVKQFSITGVLLDMQQALQPGGSQDLAMRAELFNRLRDNRNLAFLDKATEEFFQLNTPLSGLAELQAQAQEQMSAVCHTPLTVLLGITPSGLNASSEGEQRTWYDYVSGYQANSLTPLIHNVLRIVQLSLFGNIDESIFFDWEQLHELTALEDAERQKHEAETDAIYIENQVITQGQVSDRLNNDLTSMYSGTLKSDDIDSLADDDIAGITEAITGIVNETPPSATPTAPVATVAPGAPLPAVDPAAVAQQAATGTSAVPLENLV
jgi:phage-related protein (TIGR01555 family)